MDSWVNKSLSARRRTRLQAYAAASRAPKGRNVSELLDV
jgi:hypothetical protein